MPLTFEERVSEDLDALYSGAAFLAGGEGTRAQTILVEAVSAASSEYRDVQERGAFTRWMEGLLVRAFLAPRASHGSDDDLRGGHGGPSADSSSIRPEDLAGIRWVDMTRGAATVPARARAALWLVLLRRWRYDDAAATMGVGIDSLRELLAYRDAFFREVVFGDRDLNARGTGS